MKHTIDAHAHIFPAKIATKATATIGAFYGIEMDQQGSTDVISQYASFDKFVVSSSATTSAQVVAINNFIFAECQKNSKLVGLATLSPDMSVEEAQTEIDRLSKTRVHGFKFHPDFQNYEFDDVKVYPIYELLASLNFPILAHAGDKRYSRSNPRNISKVARDFPTLKICAAHFGGYSEWDKLSEYDGLENVWFDTCSSLPFISADMARSIIDRFGASRFMFGSDFPMWRPDEELERFDGIPMTPTERELILWKNAVEFYGIEI